MIKLTQLPNGKSTVMESMSGKPLLENATSSEARAFMKKTVTGPTVNGVVAEGDERKKATPATRSPSLKAQPVKGRR